MPRWTTILAGALFAARLAFCSASYAQTWLNETDQTLEADFANLQFPGAINVQASQSTGAIYGQLYEAGLTDVPGAPANVLAALGFGPAGTSPLTDLGWNWFAASYNVQVGNNDEFSRSLTAPAMAGTYSYTYRYSLDNGATWTAGDLDGAGSNAGLAFSTTQMGVMTVTAAPPPAAIDFCNLQFPATLNVQALQSTGNIYGQVYEAGVTSIPGEPAISASLGFGPAGSDPRTSQAWTWSAANYNVQIGSNDEFAAAFTAPAINGTYNYTYRFSLDGGTTWTVGDLDGNGTNDGLSFSLAQLGVLTVTGGQTPVYNPADFNQDTFVDAADLTTWKSSFGPGSGADADDDGDTDGADFLRWQRELGAPSAAPAVAAVPEPACASLIVAAVVLGLSRRGRGTSTRSA